MTRRWEPLEVPEIRPDEVTTRLRQLAEQAQREEEEQQRRRWLDLLPARVEPLTEPTVLLPFVTRGAERRGWGR